MNVLERLERIEAGRRISFANIAEDTAYLINGNTEFRERQTVLVLCRISKVSVLSRARYGFDKSGPQYSQLLLVG